MTVDGEKLEDEHADGGEKLEDEYADGGEKLEDEYDAPDAPAQDSAKTPRPRMAAAHAADGLRSSSPSSCHVLRIATMLRACTTSAVLETKREEWHICTCEDAYTHAMKGMCVEQGHVACAHECLCLYLVATAHAQCAV
jgi:hypothetical protein